MNNQATQALRELVAAIESDDPAELRLALENARKHLTAADKADERRSQAVVDRFFHL